MLDDALPDKAPAELPEVPGGWRLERFSLGPDTDVGLWAPVAPENLLDDVDVLERNAVNDAMPYWAWLWDSAPTLAKLAAREEWPRGTRVLEIGSGLGLVGIGIALAHLGRVDVTLSDHDPLAVAAAPVNARANGLAYARIWDLDWRELETAPKERFERVIGCDVIYEAALHEPLLDVLERFLARDGVAWIADPGRLRVPQFVRRAEARGFAVEFRDAEGERVVGPEAGEFRLLLLRV